jgi:hypothetical protein
MSVQQEVSVQKEQFPPGPYQTASQFVVDSLINARTSLDSAFHLDSAKGHMEKSNESEAGFNLYAYGVRNSSIVRLFAQGFLWGCQLPA